MPDPTDPYAVQIRGDILARIRDGQLREGMRLPTAPQIAEEWGVTVATVWRAVRPLREAGILVGWPGVPGLMVARVDLAQGEGEPAPAPSLTDRVAELERWRAAHERGHRG